jgi:nucleoside recognition membrane protein YjiH
MWKKKEQWLLLAPYIVHAQANFTPIFVWTTINFTPTAYLLNATRANEKQS